MGKNEKVGYAMPAVVDVSREFNLNGLAERIVKGYSEKVFPILFKFGLLDDAHVQRYLASFTFEQIYSDAMNENAQRMADLEREASFNEEDFWAPIRDGKSPVENPAEDGFIFARLPGDEPAKIVVIKALSVKDCKIHIDRRVLYEESCVYPSQENQELYALLAEFCEKFELLNRKKKHLYTLFEFEGGKWRPNIRGILGKWFIKEKEIL